MKYYIRKGNIFMNKLFKSIISGIMTVVMAMGAVPLSSFAQISAEAAIDTITLTPDGTVTKNRDGEILTYIGGDNEHKSVIFTPDKAAQGKFVPVLTYDYPPPVVDENGRFITDEYIKEAATASVKNGKIVVTAKKGM